jgi:hypothetical protein
MAETPLRLKVELFDDNPRAFAECGCYATEGPICVPCELHRGDAEWEKRFLVEAEKAIRQHTKERYRRLTM